MNKKQISKCCHASLHQFTSDIDHGYATMYYVCDVCGAPCDAIELDDGIGHKLRTFLYQAKIRVYVLAIRLRVGWLFGIKSFDTPEDLEKYLEEVA